MLEHSSRETDPPANSPETPEEQQYVLDFQSKTNELSAKLYSALDRVGADPVMKLLATLIFRITRKGSDDTLRWSWNRIGKEIGNISKDTARRAARRLEANGFVLIEQRRYETGGQKVNELTLLWAGIYEQAATLGRTRDSKLQPPGGSNVPPRGSNLLGRGSNVPPRSSNLLPPIKEYPSLTIHQNIHKTNSSSSSSTEVQRIECDEEEDEVDFSKKDFYEKWKQARPLAKRLGALLVSNDQMALLVGYGQTRQLTAGEREWVAKVALLAVEFGSDWIDPTFELFKTMRVDNPRGLISKSLDDECQLRTRPTRLHRELSRVKLPEGFLERFEPKPSAAPIAPHELGGTQT